MAYVQHTECVAAADYRSQNQYVAATIAAVLAAGVGALIAVVASRPWCIPFTLTIGAAVWLIAYCKWWLYGRLVCLGGGDYTAVGMLVSTEDPGIRSFPNSLDTDFSINLLLAPNQFGVDQATAEESPPYGFLLREQDATKNIGLPFRGEEATDIGKGIKSAVLHAEFEGGGVAGTLLGANVGLVLAVFALIACLVIPPPWGPIVAGILTLLALLAMLLGVLLGLGDEGDAADVDPRLATLTTNLGPKQNGADVLVVRGTWVYDSVHEGWNEIHPIKLCQKVATWGGMWPVDIGDAIKRWESVIDDATSPETGAAQKRPLHHWGVHPAVDGCGPDDYEPPHIR